MRFYPTREPDWYTERLSPGEKYCVGHSACKSWKKEKTDQEVNGPRVMYIYRDWEGAKMDYIFRDDCRFKKWQATRLNFRTLPQFYDKGARFIKIVKEYPVGYNWRWRPISIAEVRAIHEYEEWVEQQKKLEEKKRKEEEG